MKWTPAKVGCYWDSPEGYHISTVTEISGSLRAASYYRVAFGFDEIGRAQTLEGAKRIASAHRRTA